MDNISKTELRDAWSQWLSRREWDYFLTVTFATPRQPHQAISTLQQVEKTVRRHNTGPLFLGTELHLNRTLHVHGLLQALHGPTNVLARELWREFCDKFGRSQVRTVQSNQAVSSYVSKYVTKELTEWSLSG